jgi:hypothetical protein
MSTPNPRHCKLDGLALYAPRRARTQPTTAEERWRAKLDRIAAAIASVEAIEAERGASKSTLDIFKLAKPAHDAESSTSDIVEALEAEHDIANDAEGATARILEPAEVEHDSGSDVGSSAPGTTEGPEVEHSRESLAPDIQRALSLALGLPTPDSPSPPDEVADRPPPISIQEHLIGSGATAHDQVLHSLPRDPETLAKPPLRAPYPAAPPLFARISLVTGVAAMATFGLAIVLNVPSDSHAHKAAATSWSSRRRPGLRMPVSRLPLTGRGRNERTRRLQVFQPRRAPNRSTTSRRRNCSNAAGICCRPEMSPMPGLRSRSSRTRATLRRRWRSPPPSISAPVPCATASALLPTMPGHAPGIGGPWSWDRPRPSAHSLEWPRNEP